MNTSIGCPRSRRRQIWGALALLTLSAVLVGCPKKTGTADGSGGGSGDQCSDEFVAGQPTTTTKTQLLCHDEYISVYDPARKVPLLVAEKLQPDEFDGSVSRESSQFRPDPGLDASQSASMNDYTRSGYARGHMAPAGDFSGTEAAMNQSFYFSNVVPQNSAMNSGIWSQLERATRDCAKQLGTLYVMTGPVFEGATKAIGSGDVAVPSAIYKIVAANGKSRAFVVPNLAPGKKLPQNRSKLQFSDNQMSVDEVQRLTSLSFFPGGGVDTSDQARLCSDLFASR